MRRHFNVSDYAASDVPYPFRGRLKTSEVCPSLNSATSECFSRSDSQYEVLSVPYGDANHPAARVREKSTTFHECENLLCASTKRETVVRDATWGYPTLIRETDLSGTGGQTREFHRTYHHDYGIGKWLLGMPDSEEVYGYTQDVSGNSQSLALLKHVSYSYDGRGRITDEYVHDISRPLCQNYSPADAHTRFQYRASGVVESISSTGGQQVLGRNIKVLYDALELHPQAKLVNVGQYEQGARISSKTLSESYIYDLRHGRATSYTDVNGHNYVSTYDSLGRTIEEIGPDGAYLSVTEHQDSWPRSVLTETYHGTGTVYAKTFLDGDGRPLATVTASDGSDLRRTRTEYAHYDGVGRKIRHYHPVFAGSRASGDSPYYDLKNLSLSQVKPTAGEVYDETSYDYIGRPVEQRQANGSQHLITSIEYVGPRAVKTTLPEGNYRTRYTDWQGNLVGVEHFDQSGNIRATYSYVRDGLGRIVEIEDADGNIRHLQRDQGGRVTRLDLPHKAGVDHTHGDAQSARMFDLCYTPHGDILKMFTPEGRSVTINRDELGRPHHTIADSKAGSVESFATYDSSSNGLGRLSSLEDASGTLNYSYDEYGRPYTIEFAPSTAILSAAPNLASSYTANFDYDRQGQLNSVSVDGLGALDASLNYSRDGMGRVDNVWSNFLPSYGGTAVQQDLVIGVDYNAYGNIISSDLGYNFTTEWYYRDGTQRLTDVVYNGMDAKIGLANYSYDANGNVISEGRALSSYSSNVEIWHTYDALDRLDTTEFVADGIDRIADFDYSAGGNINSVDVSEDGVSNDELYAYTDPTLPQAVQSIDYQDSGDVRTVYYDADGRVIQDELVRQDGSSELRTLSYDAAGCLLSVNVQEDDGIQIIKDMTSENVCGQGGRRVLRKTINHLTGEVNTVIDFAGIAEIRPHEGRDDDGDGAVDGIMLMRVPVGGTVRVEQARSLKGGHVIEEESGHIHTDIRGSVIAKTSYRNISSDDAPLIEKQADYDAWGNTIEYTSHSAPRHQFVDFEPDKAAGYYYMGARIYDPTLRRWLSPDPLLAIAPKLDEKLGDQLNLYSYARNRPVSAIDPSGLFTAVITTYGDYGLEMGDHSAVYIERDGEAYLYDPAGSFLERKRGTSHLIPLKEYKNEEGEPLSLKDYLEYQEQISTKVSLQAFDTTEQDEQQILDSIRTREAKGERAVPLECTQACRTALRAADFFDFVEKPDGPVDLPGVLNDELQDQKTGKFETIDEARETQKKRETIKGAGSSQHIRPVNFDELDRE